MTVQTAAPIGELVAGLDTVGALAIPYARLPRRAFTAYAGEFVRWSDLAGQTVESLLERRWAGESTVKALLAAAENAVASYRAAQKAPGVGASTAVHRLLSEMSERDVAVLAAQVWPDQPQPQSLVAEQLGVSKVWLTRNRRRIVARFGELLDDPVHRCVQESADRLCSRLGSYAPASLVAAELQGLDVDTIDNIAAQVLLFVAGPYRAHDGWFTNTTTMGDQCAARAVEAVFSTHEAPSTGKLTRALAGSGMSAEAAEAYLQTHMAGFKRFDNVWVEWGESYADRFTGVLQMLGKPATAETLTQIAGIETKAKNAQSLLSVDPRFVRASRVTWGLRTWDLVAYSGISDELATRIQSAGGRIAIDALVESLGSDFPDVAETSVRAYLRTLAFIVEDGMVRLRTEADKLPSVAPPTAVRGVYRCGSHEIRWSFPVSRDVLRGSSIAVPAPVASAIGMEPAATRVFANPIGDLSVTWPLDSVRGPLTGSIRRLANQHDAALGDTLVLVFNSQNATVQADLVRAATTGTSRLQQILGRPTRGGAALARSLDCRPSEVEQVLRRRGDHDIADIAAAG